ncbi:MAG: virulence RhuM family protein [Bacteroides sp.]|nr:virulence RhuM family protein [Bacteroides sp.]
MKNKIAMDDNNQIRRWATERLKGNGEGAYWRELLDRIRDIRSSEKVMYRQVLDLYAAAVDYGPRSEIFVEFFKIV